MKPITILFFMLIFFLLLALSVAAQEDYRLSGGIVSHGGESNGGVYTLTISQDQPHGGSPLSGGDYTLRGGVWVGTGSGTNPPARRIVYLPLILR